MISEDTMSEIVRRVSCPACGATWGPCSSVKSGARYVNGYFHTRRIERAEVIVRLVVDEITKEREQCST